MDDVGLDVARVHGRVGGVPGIMSKSCSSERRTEGQGNGTDLQGGDDALEGGHGACVGGAETEAGYVLGHVAEDELEVDKEAFYEDGARDGVGGGIADEGDLDLRRG